ncbi:DNA polymerase IV [Kordiimonas marina]|uniref:DNA polymerase IV n=1 Tax=Kordiimonas marina TaxID=2872312 RepID=UPI001FF2907A|nr:DNA polymerase IV [Kordiimonas marina]MCJ9429234.1 DNA polymerase IV [Kordiimonas marina]
MTPPPEPDTPVLCRSCLHIFEGGARKCPNCGKPRLVSHPELLTLKIAHLDCDAFYASIEKRDNPELASKPLIIGGGDQRGVVSTCCYIARMSGVRSAMPMYQARKLCPDAVVLHPNMKLYAQVGHQVRAMMQDLTPLVEPLSIDEAFMDFTGTERLHGAPAAALLADLAGRVEREVGISVSIGLAPNKFLAKLASDMDKPRGFTVIGETDAKSILAELPISRIYGVGAKSAERLRRDGLTQISQLQTMEEATLARRYGETGLRLWRLSRGIDTRKVEPRQPVKSVSSERTLDRDLADYDQLEQRLWALSENVSEDLKRKGLAGLTVTLKLKTSMHRIITRSRTLDGPTQLAATLFEVGQQLLKPLTDGTPYRLIGIGMSHFRPLQEADQPDLIEPGRTRRQQAEAAMDALRGKYGKAAIVKGRGFDPAKDASPAKKSKD